MTELNPLRWWRRLLDLPNTSQVKAMVVVLLVSVICAVAVSVAAVVLRPLQLANLEAARKAQLATLLKHIPGFDRNGDRTNTDVIEPFVRSTRSTLPCHPPC